MKLCLLLLIVGIFQTKGNILAQKISLDVKNEPITNVFRDIMKQSPYTFAYWGDFIKSMRPVTAKINDAPIEDVMDALLKGTDWTYGITGYTVSIKPRAKEKNPINIPSIQGVGDPPITIRGRVINEENEPVAGVTVQVKGTKVATATDGEGEFELSKIDPNSTLVITGVNIQPIEANINGRTKLDLNVKGKTGKLDEVQVIAYGKTSQRFATGNTASIKFKEIEKQAINNPLLALQGRVSGVEVVQANGIPGGGVTIRIQGRNNLNGAFTGSDPLIVVDGVPYPSQNLKSYRGGDNTKPILGNSSESSVMYGNPLGFINPSDIESINVLKDADATAIYGSRAANGAILITTKKGKPGQPKIDINIQQGLGQVAKQMDLLNSQQYMEMRREAKANDNAKILTTDYDLRGFWDTTRNTNWQKELIGGTAHYNRSSASISGGTSNMSYLIGGTFSRETSVFPGDFADTREALHFNINATPTQKFKLQLSGSYMADNNELPGKDFTPYALGLPPVAPSLYNLDGTLNWAQDPLNSGNSSWINPLATNYYLFENKSNSLISNAILSYKLLPNLEIKTSVGFTSLTSNQFIAEQNNAIRPERRPNRTRIATFTFNNTASWIVEPQLTYDFRIGNAIKFDALLGGTIQQKKNEGRSFSASGQPSDILLKDMSAATTLTSSVADISTYRYAGIFSRLNFNLLNKYLLNLSARRDGSSRFGSSKQFQTFGAVGLGWIFSDEKVLKNAVKLLSFGKIRASYGTSGNDQIGDYGFLSLYYPSGAIIPYQGTSGLTPGGLPNPNLEWEENRKLQFGLDLGIINDRILLTVNYIRNRSSNNLASVSLPAIAGNSRFTDNIPALIENTGWEFSLSSELIKARHLSWSINLNMTLPSNKVVELPDAKYITVPMGVIVGYPLGVTKTYYYSGVDPLTGLNLVYDQYGNPTAKPNFNTDAVFIKKTNTTLFGGIQNHLSFKGFELDFLFQISQKYGDLLEQLGSFPGTFSPTDFIGNQPKDVLHRWQKPGDQSNYQRFTTSLTQALNAGNKLYHEISFARLKNATLTYQLNSNFIKRIKIQNCKLFANGQNLLTLTNYNGLDPETLSVTSLPPLRMVTVGIQIIL